MIPCLAAAFSCSVNGIGSLLSILFVFYRDEGGVAALSAHFQNVDQSEVVVIQPKPLQIVYDLPALPTFSLHQQPPSCYAHGQCRRREPLRWS